MPYKKDHGFTLLEILIVIIITTLIGGMLIQGLSQSLLIQNKLQQSLTILQQQILTNEWFKQSTKSLLITYSEQQFIGKKNEFTGISLQALNTESGIPMIISWSINTQNQVQQLIYKEAQDKVWIVRQWDHTANNALEVYFQYRNSEGLWYDHWPVKTGISFDPKKNTTALLLPSAIRVSVSEDDEYPLFVTLINNKLPKIMYRDLL